MTHTFRFMMPATCLVHSYDYQPGGWDLQGHYCRVPGNLLWRDKLVGEPGYMITYDLCACYLTSDGEVIMGHGADPLDKTLYIPSSPGTMLSVSIWIMVDI